MKELRKQSKSTPLLRGALALILALSMMGSIGGCAEGHSHESTSVEQEMVDYYNIESVKSFHRDLQTAVNNTVSALQTDDTELMNSALKELDTLCAGFKKVTDVPASLTSYHDKMIEVTKHLQTYCSDIKSNDIESAAKSINKASKELAEAKELLPQTTQG